MGCRGEGLSVARIAGVQERTAAAVTQPKYKYYLSDVETELMQEMAVIPDDKKIR